MPSPRRIGPTPSDTTAPAKTVRLVDAPADGDGRRYVIERELTVMAELQAIVADYLEQAATWDVIPAAGPCCLLADACAREAVR